MLVNIKMNDVAMFIQDLRVQEEMCIWHVKDFDDRFAKIKLQVSNEEYNFRVRC